MIVTQRFTPQFLLEQSSRIHIDARETNRCLGKPEDRPSAMVGVLINQAFTFPEMISVDLVDQNGEIAEGCMRVAYPCRPPHYHICGGYGHTVILCAREGLGPW